MNRYNLLVVAALGAVGVWFFWSQFHIDGLDSIRLRPRDGANSAYVDLMDAPPVTRSGDTVRVATFNVQVLGRTKASKPHVMEIGLFDSLRSGKILGRSKIALSERKRLHWVTASTLAIMLLAVAALLFKQETEEQTAEVPVTSLDTSVTDKPVTEKPVKKKPVETVSSESNSWLSSPPSLLDDKEQRIEELLSQAKTAIKEYRLSTPENDNAYDYYKQVLVLDPNNEDANDGINDIADKYADLVERELDQFDYFEGDKYMVRGLAIQPDNPRLRALQKSTNALRDAPKRAYGKIKSIFD